MKPSPSWAEFRTVMEAFVRRRTVDRQTVATTQRHTQDISARTTDLALRVASERKRLNGCCFTGTDFRCATAASASLAPCGIVAWGSEGGWRSPVGQQFQ